MSLILIDHTQTIHWEFRVFNSLHEKTMNNIGSKGN